MSINMTKNKELDFLYSCNIINTMKQIFIIIFLITFVTLFSQQIYATTEPILITHSTGIHNVIFDGKWTNEIEWKYSSHNTFSYDDGMNIHLRTAHYEDFIYVFVDPINDQTLDEQMDKATICFDGENNKNTVFDRNDFCFSVLLNQKQGILKQGSTNEIIDNVEFIATSSVSDENDRYSKNTHSSYEFKIPIELFGRSDNYGFYLSVYDASLDKFYLWPKNSTGENTSEIPPPSKWGDIISPDKSLPEMNIPILIFTVMIFTIILIQSRTRIQLLRS